ncbi:MAG: hypothetical protein H0T42_22580 [Deltaproteobacteria bacterium]|nr:hypothetical protein [Deltaproteobacteria bacterium]
MSFSDFSSWPRDQEQSFVVYEQRAAESERKAWTIGGICGAVALVFMVGVYAGVEPEHKDMTKDMNMSNLTKKETDKKDAPAAAAPADPAPAAPAADPAPAAPTPATP